MTKGAYINRNWYYTDFTDFKEKVLKVGVIKQKKQKKRMENCFLGAFASLRLCGKKLCRCTLE